MKQFIRNVQRNFQRRFIRSQNNGKWVVVVPNSRAGALCEKSAGKSDSCWLAESELYSRIEYNGKVSRTESGIKCAKWNQPVHRNKPHKYRQNESDNYCRNPDNDTVNGPWCYTTDPNKRWEKCNIPA